MILITLFSMFAVAFCGYRPPTQSTCDKLKDAYEQMCPITTTAIPTTTITPTMTTTSVPTQAADYCDFMYEGKCFWIEVDYDEMTFETGENLCKAKGGMPANIYSKNHYYIVMGYMRMLASMDGQFYVWLGLKYDRKTNSALLANGGKAHFLKWHAGYPSSSYCCRVTLVAKADLKESDQHLHNWKQTPSKGKDLRRGIVCEK